MRSRPTRGRARGAFTALEVMIALVILGLVLGSVAMVGSAGERAFEAGSVRAHLEAQTVAALERAIQDLRIAAADSLAPALDGGEVADGITYVQAVGLDAGAVVLSATRRLAFEYEVGEIDDGLDNNGNGLVDEGRLVLTEDVGTPDEHSRVLTRWVRELQRGEEPNGLDDDGDGLVDEPGFLVRRSGRTLVVELTLERRDREGRPHLRTARSSTKLRN